MRLSGVLQSALNLRPKGNIDTLILSGASPLFLRHMTQKGPLSTHLASKRCLLTSNVQSLEVCLLDFGGNIREKSVFKRPRTSKR